MDSKEKFLYILDYWVPFPASEYGGLITLIAENDQEALEVLSEEDSFENDHGHLMMKEMILRHSLIDRNAPRLDNMPDPRSATQGSLCQFLSRPATLPRKTSH